MGYIEKRGKNSWRISTAIKQPDGKWKPYHETYHANPDLPEEVQRLEAKRELAMMEIRLSGRITAAYTVRSWSEEWLLKHLGPDCSPVTVSNYRTLLNSRILPALGDLALDELTPALLTDWLIDVRNSPRRSTRLPDDKLSRPRRENEKLISETKRKKPLASKTVSNYYGCMSTMLSAAVRMGYLEHNPMERVQHPRVKKKARAVLTEEGALSLIAALQNEPPQYRLAIILALVCGLRLGEVTALWFDDVDFLKNEINISRALKYTAETGSFLDDPKTEASARTITMPESLHTMLWRALMQDLLFIQELEEDGKKPPFPRPKYIIHNEDGTRLNKDTPSKWFRRFADAHGFEGIRFHDLRHAHASILVAHGIDVAAVASRMGHSSPSVTLDVYAHAFRRRDQEAADALDPLLAPLTTDNITPIRTGT